MKAARNSDRQVRWLRLPLLSILGAWLVVACASYQQADFPAQPVPGDMEEVTVTGSRVSTGPARNRMQQSQVLRRSELQRLNATRDRAADTSSVRPGVEEELWIIAKPDPALSMDPNADPGPGSGAMLAHLPADPAKPGMQGREIPLPLRHTAVEAVIHGYISTVNVRQTFANPFNSKIEAVYLFPLPEKAAVSEFVMTIGDRRIRGILREKAQAEAIYREARSQGYQASLLVQRRPNVFEQKVANIEPGRSIDVDIKYFHTLAYDDGHYSFVFPTVVGPRYNQPGAVDPIEAVARSDGRFSGAVDSVPYLRPDERSAHDLSISVEINAGVTIEEVWSTHDIVAKQSGPEKATIELADQTMMPNRDFILNFSVAGKAIKSNLLTYLDPASGQGYFTLMVYPPATTDKLARRAMEMVFVLDCSGSMSGTPLDQAKAAVESALSNLRPDDTFQIIRFSDNASRFGETPVRASQSNIAKARRYLERLSGTGGTEMIEGVRAALDFPHDDTRLRFVSFMTDGYIGNEADIIKLVHERIGASRIFSFGVGSSVNRYLLERMASAGRGAVAYLGPQDSGASVMDDFFRRISHAALTDVEIDWGSMAVSDVYPGRLPDMFVGRPVVVTGKFLGSAGTVTLTGRADDRSYSQAITNVDSNEGNAPVARIWARLRIADLADRQAMSGDPYGEFENSILSTALEHQLMSQYTSFVAVDTSRRTEGDHGTTVHQALPVPNGVRYDTTVDTRKE